jgi:hypothetical protein
MPERGFSLPEVAALVVLMVTADEISNPELKERYGLTLTGAERKKLNELKLVESRKQGRAYVHSLTDDGWARTAEIIRSGVALPSGSVGAIARAMLSWLPRFMDRTDQRPSDLFQPEPQPEPLSEPSPESPAELLAEAVPADITERIRAAYATLAPEPGTWVKLARLRPLLGEATRAEVDGALKGMIHLPDVTIVPEVNQKTLTPEDRAAAVIIGDQDKHLISIGAR